MDRIEKRNKSQADAQASQRAVVIGGGLGGLSAAIRLSLSGFAVTLCEASKELGGKAGRVVVDGIEVDTGPSLVTLPRVFEELFQIAGWQLENELRLRPLSETFSYHWPDGMELRFHQDPSLRQFRIEKTLGNQAAKEMDDLLKVSEQIWQGASPHFLFAPKPTLRNLGNLSPWAFLSLPSIGAERSLANRLGTHLQNPYLHDIFMRFATYNGSDPRRTPSTFLCIAHVEMGEQKLGLGSYGIEGGIFEMVRALGKLAAHVGVDIRLGSTVDKVVTENEDVCGVMLRSGEYIDAQTVVSNADTHWLEEHLLREANKKSKKKSESRFKASRSIGTWRKFKQQTFAQKTEPSTSGWNAIVRTKRYSDRTPHTVLFPKDYEGEFRALFDECRVPDDPTIYICAPEKAHGRKGWADHEPLFVMVNTPPIVDSEENAERCSKATPSNSPEELGRLRSQVMKRLRDAKLIESDAEIVWERNPQELASRFPGSSGSLYGNASNSIWSAFARPDNRHPRYRGLYLASGSAHPGGGMPLAILSGKHAAEAAVKDRKEFKPYRAINRMRKTFYVGGA